MWLRVIVLTFALCVQACGSGEAGRGDADSLASPAQQSVAADKDSAPEQGLSAGQELCDYDTLPAGIQRRVTRGDTLVLDLEREGEPGPEYLDVEDPSGLLFFVVYPYAQETVAGNPASEEFAGMKTFSFQVDELSGTPVYYGGPNAAPVFHEPGMYLVSWGLNFETDAAWIQDSVRVLYCPGG